MAGPNLGGASGVLGVLLVVALGILGCTRTDVVDGRGEEREEGSEPSFPALIELGTDRCRHCGKGRRGGQCVHGWRFGCRGGGSCEREIPCDPGCCPEPVTQDVGLEAAPWGPVLEAARSVVRPTGVLAWTSRDDVVVLRPASPRATAVARVQAPTYGARWSSASSQLVVSSGYDLTVFQPSSWSTATAEGPDVMLDLFDVSAGGGLAVYLEHDREMVVWRVDLTTTPPVASKIEGLSGRLDSVSLSPDGTRVALGEEGGPRSSVRIADVQSGEHHDFPPDHAALSGAAWHPSGEFLVAWRLEESGGSCALTLVEPTGVRYAKSAIVPPAGEGQSCHRFAISPDGRFVAYTVLPVGRSGSEIHLADLTGEEPPSVIARDVAAHALVWLPESARAGLGQMVASGSPCIGCPPQVRVQPVELSSASFAAVARAAPVAQAAEQEGWLAFVDEVEGKPQLRAVPAAGGTAVTVTAEPDGAWGPTWAPDGAHVAYATGTPTRVAVLDLATGATARPRVHGPSLGVPAWSPKEARIAIAQDGEGGSPEPKLVAIRPNRAGHWSTASVDDSHAQVRLDGRPSWTADGDAVLVCRDVEGRSQCYLGQPRYRGTLTDLSPNLSAALQPQLHPSGQLIAVWLGAAGHYRLGFASPGGDAWALTDVIYDAPWGGRDPDGVAFSPDGSSLAYAVPDPKGSGISIVIAPVSDPGRTTVVARSEAGYPDVAWSTEPAVMLLDQTLPFDPASTPPPFVPETPSGFAEPNALDRALTRCRKAHAVAVGTKVGLDLTATGATGAITKAIVTGPQAGTEFAACLETVVSTLKLSRFTRETYSYGYHFSVAETSVGSGL